eukprot:TRINITY_DN3780_c0_g1_i1.p1 TRINITY_DN3780_c0_g1~~TRINITY_DN3780_c0_g1_i1.p1  ORF type:complete len:1105 (+),score=156.77 TRINITY_DN3780_c0_g1_i1:78-3317(+)
MEMGGISDYQEFDVTRPHFAMPKAALQRRTRLRIALIVVAVVVIATVATITAVASSRNSSGNGDKNSSDSTSGTTGLPAPEVPALAPAPTPPVTAGGNAALNTARRLTMEASANTGNSTEGNATGSGSVTVSSETLGAGPGLRDILVTTVGSEAMPLAGAAVVANASAGSVSVTGVTNFRGSAVPVPAVVTVTYDASDASAGFVSTVFNTGSLESFLWNIAPGVWDGISIPSELITAVLRQTVTRANVTVANLFGPTQKFSTASNKTDGAAEYEAVGTVQALGGKQLDFHVVMRSDPNTTSNATRLKWWAVAAVELPQPFLFSSLAQRLRPLDALVLSSGRLIFANAPICTGVVSNANCIDAPAVLGRPVSAADVVPGFSLDGTLQLTASGGLDLAAQWLGLSSDAKVPVHVTGLTDLDQMELRARIANAGFSLTKDFVTEKPNLYAGYDAPGLKLASGFDCLIRLTLSDRPTDVLPFTGRLYLEADTSGTTAGFTAEQTGVWLQPFGVQQLVVNRTRISLGVGPFPTMGFAPSRIEIGGTVEFGSNRLSANALVGVDTAEPRKSVLIAGLGPTDLGTLFTELFSGPVKLPIPSFITGTLSEIGLNGLVLAINPQTEAREWNGKRYGGGLTVDVNKLDLAGVIRGTAVIRVDPTKGLLVNTSVDPVGVGGLVVEGPEGSGLGPQFVIQAMMNEPFLVSVSGGVRLLAARFGCELVVNDTTLTLRLALRTGLFDCDLWLSAASEKSTGIDRLLPSSFSAGGSFNAAVLGSLETEVPARIEKRRQRAVDEVTAAEDEVQVAKANVTALTAELRAARDTAYKKANSDLTAAQADVDKLKADITAVKTDIASKKQQLSGFCYLSHSEVKPAEGEADSTSRPVVPETRGASKAQTQQFGGGGISIPVPPVPIPPVPNPINCITDTAKKATLSAEIAALETQKQSLEASLVTAQASLDATQATVNAGASAITSVAIQALEAGVTAANQVVTAAEQSLSGVRAATAGVLRAAAAAVNGANQGFRAASVTIGGRFDARSSSPALPAVLAGDYGGLPLSQTVSVRDWDVGNLAEQATDAIVGLFATTP